jgi:hypothetical protein
MNAYAAGAIQGRAAQTAGKHYGDVTMKARKITIDMLPRYVI